MMNGDCDMTAAAAVRPGSAANRGKQQQHEKKKNITEKQDASVMNDTIMVKTEEKPESLSQSVSQLSMNASTSIPVESTSAKYVELINSSDVTDTVNSSSNESALKASKDACKPAYKIIDFIDLDSFSDEPDIVNLVTDTSSSDESALNTSKDTDNLKRPLVEEKVEHKRRKDHSQRSKGKNEASSAKPDSNADKSVLSGSSSASSPGGGPKVPPLKIVIPTTDADTGTRTNGKNGNRSHHHTALPYVYSEKLLLASNQSNSPKLSNRRGSISSVVPNRGTSPIVSEEQLAQTNSSAAVIADMGSTNPSPGTCSKTTENVSATISEDDKQSTSTAGTTAATKSESILTAELSYMDKRRRKLKASRTESETSDTSSVANITAVETNSSGTTSEPPSFTNWNQIFLNNRKQINKRYKNLFPVQPKPPSGFENYLMNKRTYALAGNSNNQVVNTQTPLPANLHEQLKKLFVEQDQKRQKLRIQHTVEKEKLVLCIEQEILRVHSTAARELANQPLPFSVCTILKDAEVYNIVTPEEEEEKEDNLPRSACNGRSILSMLQELDEKWEKIKESMLLRHRSEAECLHTTQKMDWVWKLWELKLCPYSSQPNIDEEHVPMVLISDFDLPA